MNFAPGLRDELIRVLEAVVIHSPSSFTFAGHGSDGLAPRMQGLLLEAGAPPLMNELTSWIYQHCYSTRFNGRIENDELPSTPVDVHLLNALTRANQSQERWEDGWRALQSMPNGQIIARKGTLTRMLAPGEFVNLSGSGTMLAPETPLRVYVPRESRTIQPGYYFAFGETTADALDEYSTARFYWNVSAPGAAQLLELVSRELNLWQVPFRFKSGIHPAMYSRCDSAVLYVPRRAVAFTYQLLLGVLDRMSAFLRPEVPLFALRLDDGLGFADDPGTSESFGMSRCRTLAQAIWRAHCEGALAIDDWLKLVEEQFLAEGIALEKPWLAPGLVDDPSLTAVEGGCA
jgi:hypothetical protein